MQCKCGADTKTKFSSRTVKKILVAYLEWEECVSCGRVGGEITKRELIKGDFEITKKGPNGRGRWT